MTVSINGSGGITYPDGSVNTTRSVSTAGDTMTGTLNLNGGARIANQDLWFDSTGNTSWKQTNYLGALYLNNGTDRFIVGPTGIVSMPNQPACYVSRNSGGETIASATTYGVAVGGGGAFRYNRGGFYQGGTIGGGGNVVHVPRAGMYHFTVQIYAQGSSNANKRMSLVGSTGTTIAMMNFDGGFTGDGIASVSSVAYMQADEYFYFANANYGAMNWYSAFDHTFVSCHFLG